MSDGIFQSAEVRQRLLAYISRRDRNSAASEDVLQETLLRLLEQTRKKTIDNPMAYAFRIADNVIFARARQRKRETDLGDLDFECPAPRGDQVLEYKQRLALFREGLLAMTPVRRAVFVKRHLEDKSRGEIAEEMNLSLEAVKKHLLRGMIELTNLNDALENPTQRGVAKGSSHEQ